MKRIFLALSITAAAPIGLAAQGIDLGNVQVHGFATQGLLYSTNNNWNTTDSSDGSAAWTEVVASLAAQPESKLRIGMQARYFLLGNFGNAVTLDWAQGDYKVNEKFGFRAGKVKTPTGLLNDVQDVDPAYLWVTLPQSIYPIASRNSLLAHYGGVAYGSLPLGESFGKLDYRAFGGERVLGTDDGTFVTLKDSYGITPTGPATIPLVGGTLSWNTPLRGLLLGGTGVGEHLAGGFSAGPYSGRLDASWVPIPLFFAKYEHHNLMLSGEYARFAPGYHISFPGYGSSEAHTDQRSFYLMGSYKLSGKLSGGLYYSSSNDHQAPFTSARYQKDWVLAGRYDFNPSLYVKLEQHVLDGTEIGFFLSDNSGNIKRNTLLTLLKLGVSF